MIEFIPPQTRFRPIKPRFWDRQYGNEFLEWELNLIKEFNQAKKQRFPIISGTVITDSKLGKSRFLLIPTPWLIQDYITCICPRGLPLPSNMSYVTVHGEKIDFQDRSEIIVDEVKPSKLERIVEPEIDYKEFQDLLFLKWSGIESPLRDLLAFEIVSSPPIFEKAGGLNLSVYDGTGEKLNKKVLSYIKWMIPSDLTKEEEGLLKVPWISTRASFRLPNFHWSFKIVDADKPLSEFTLAFLSERKVGRSHEISMSLGSEKQAPESLYEPPCSLVDQPSFLQSGVEIRPIHLDPPPEITKYIIATHLLSPTIGDKQEDQAKSLNVARERIFTLAEKSDLPHLVAKHAIFDPNIYGKPQSIIRTALASARAVGKTKITANDILSTFDNYFAKNFEMLLDAWPSLFTSKGIEISSPGLTNTDREILKFIDHNETKEFAVSLSKIQDHFFNLDPMKLRDALNRLMKTGKIYEDKNSFFRTTPLE